MRGPQHPIQKFSRNVTDAGSLTAWTEFQSKRHWRGVLNSLFRNSVKTSLTRGPQQPFRCLDYYPFVAHFVCGYMLMRILTCACIRIFAHMHMFCMAIPSSNILTHQSHISQVIRKVKSAASLLERSEYKKNSVKFNNHPAYHQTSGFDIVVAYICNMHVEEAKQRSCCRLILGFQPWRGKTNDSDF